MIDGKTLALLQLEESVVALSLPMRQVRFNIFHTVDSQHKTKYLLSAILTRCKYPMFLN